MGLTFVNGLTGGTKTHDVVLRVEHILALLHLEAELLGVLHEILDGLVLTNVLTELVISVRVGSLGEVDGVLDDSDVVLVYHGLASCNLEHDVTLRELEVLHIVDCQGVDAVKVVLRFLIHRVGVLVHGRGEPVAPPTWI